MGGFFVLKIFAILAVMYCSSAIFWQNVWHELWLVMPGFSVWVFVYGGTYCAQEIAG